MRIKPKERMESFGETALHLLVKGEFNNASGRVFKNLVAKGSDVNASDSEGRRPLEVAISYRRHEFVVKLIEAGALLEPDKRGFSPLHLYCNEGALEAATLRAFVGSSRCDINGLTDKGWTPLLIFINSQESNGSQGEEGVAALLSSGADPFLVNNCGDNILSLALLKGYNHSVDHLLTALGKERVAQMVNVPNAEGFFPLHLALLSPLVTFATVSRLISCGAQINAQNRLFENLSALHLLVLNFESVNGLYNPLAFKRNIMLLHRTFDNDLFRKKRTLCFRHLFHQNGLNVNIRAEIGTPLTYAFASSEYSLAHDLIKNAFADVLQCDLRHFKLIKGPFVAAFQLLFEAGFRNFRPLRDTDRSTAGFVERRNLDNFRKWLERKAREVPYLSKMAANVVRRVYGLRVKQLLEEIESKLMAENRFEPFKRVLLLDESPKRGGQQTSLRTSPRFCKLYP